MGQVEWHLENQQTEFMRDNGKMTKSMAVGYSHGKTHIKKCLIRFTMVSTRMVWSMAKEYMCGREGRCIQGSSSKIFTTTMVNLCRMYHTVSGRLEIIEASEIMYSSISGANSTTNSDYFKVTLKYVKNRRRRQWIQYENEEFSAEHPQPIRVQWPANAVGTRPTDSYEKEPITIWVGTTKEKRTSTPHQKKNPALDVIAKEKCHSSR